MSIEDSSIHFITPSTRELRNFAIFGDLQKKNFFLTRANYRCDTPLERSRQTGLLCKNRVLKLDRDKKLRPDQLLLLSRQFCAIFGIFLDFSI